MTTPDLRPRPLDPTRANPFPAYDREIRRLRTHLQGLKDKAWSRASHCRGWSVKDIVAHLSTNEVYNQACLDGSHDQLTFPGGLDGWNGRGVRIRRGLDPVEALQEWEARQERVRRAWAQIGLSGWILTSAGRYPLRLQVWHLAREYAIHGDDIEASISTRDRKAELRWRVAFGLFAAREEGEPIDARLVGDVAELSHDGHVYKLDLETFVAYLNNRPQQLRDAGKRRLVRQLAAAG
ncbi:MAG: maleylpyruvate isomerase family mycothiol-dependent enzyme [Candidatus Dormibacteraeota bacterium]|nr:maleylpyruvate isomerase family mycothiol-dependent enzyme [Candidatus Dormibacteraeota bacterium]